MKNTFKRVCKVLKNNSKRLWTNGELSKLFTKEQKWVLKNKFIFNDSQ